MLTLEIKRDSVVVGTATIQRMAGEYVCTFISTDGTRYTSRVQMDECDVWSALKALLQEMESA